jgi:hypothetical protein
MSKLKTMIDSNELESVELFSFVSECGTNFTIFSSRLSANCTIIACLSVTSSLSLFSTAEIFHLSRFCEEILLCLVGGVTFRKQRIFQHHFFSAHRHCKTSAIQLIIIISLKLIAADDKSFLNYS